jgi:protein-S-isoprenylcysteine O-methyltransferase Ste14
MSQRPPLSKILQRHRVRIARILWWVLLIYLFLIERITIIPLASTPGLVGIGVIGLGLLVRSLSAGMLHKNQVLASEGIYAMVRNPLYFGSLLLLVGVNIIIANWLMAVSSMVLFAITYIPTIKGEESGLAHAYGEEWEAFKKSTPRLFPNLLKLGELRNSRWSYPQWVKNHEHNTVLAAIGILIVLQLYSSYFAGTAS